MMNQFIIQFVIHAAPGLTLCTIAAYLYWSTKPKPMPMTDECARAVVRGAIEDNLYKNQGGDAT